MGNREVPTTELSTMVYTLTLLLCMILFASTAALETEEVKVVQSRQPKLFWVSSSATTSSVSTSTICFVSATTGFTTCKDDSDADIESGAEEPAASQRDGRFLLYWLTTTTTSTTTIFTATGTIATLACTPAGYTVNACS